MYTPSVSASFEKQSRVIHLLFCYSLCQFSHLNSCKLHRHQDALLHPVSGTPSPIIQTLVCCGFGRLLVADCTIL